MRLTMLAANHCCAHDYRLHFRNNFGNNRKKILLLSLGVSNEHFVIKT